MRFAIATEPAPGHINEDFAAATMNAAVLLDGAGLSDVDDGGCIHGVAWYVRRLGSELLTRLADERAGDLVQVLGDAIEEVAGSHRKTCDLDHPGTPSSTVVMVRQRGESLQYLVLADSVLVINECATRQVISDTREAAVGRTHRGVMDALPAGSTAHDDARRKYVERLRTYRNRPDGFWVAAASPEAASQSVTGGVDTDKVLSVVLLSDGASRLVDRFHLATWDEATELITASGCRALLRRVRDAEHGDLHGHRWPRGKTFDDATVVYCDFPHR